MTNSHRARTAADVKTNRWQRRDFVKGVAALAGAAGLLPYGVGQAAAEPAPETTRIRLYQAPTICLAPQYVAEDLLRAEGFSEIEYATLANPAPSPMTSQKAESISA